MLQSFSYLLKMTQTLGVREELSERLPRRVAGTALLLVRPLLGFPVLPVWPPAAPSGNIQLCSHLALSFLVLLSASLICQAYSLPLAESP